MSIAIYPGSFDPITLGHVDVLTRASKLFGKIIMAVIKNPNKPPFFSLPERLELVKYEVSHLPNVEVACFEGLTVSFAESCQAQAIIRGLRAVSDFEYECLMAQMNKSMCPHIDTLFLMADKAYQFLSSSVVKEAAILGGNVSFALSGEVNEALNRKIRSLKE